MKAFNITLISFAALSVLLITMLALLPHLSEKIRLYKQCTKYASGYSEEKFNKIQKGISEAEVLKTLGKPRYEFDSGMGNKSWSYSNQECGLSDFIGWEQKGITVNDGKVIDTWTNVFFN